MNAAIGSELWNKNAIKSALDNRANQLNPNNSAYWSSRAGNTSVGPVSAGMAGVLGIIAGTAIAAVAVALVATYYRKKEESVTEEPLKEVE